MQQLLDAMFARDVQPGENVIEVGDDGDNFYVIERCELNGCEHCQMFFCRLKTFTIFSSVNSGTFDIIVPIEGQMTRVAQYDGKGAFGELALMYNQPRSATVRATSRGRLWALDRKSFRKIVVQSAFRKRKLYEALLEKVEILAALTAAERTNLADALVPKTFVAGNDVAGAGSSSRSSGTVIIRQGDEADGMYFVVDGKCRVEIQQPDGTKKVITTLGKGDYFGELGLINRKPRAATVYAEGPKTTVACKFFLVSLFIVTHSFKFKHVLDYFNYAVLDVGAFERMLGPCIDIMKRKMSQYQ